MKAGDALRHGAVCLSSVFLLLGLPFLRSGAFSELLSGKGVDTVSGATVVLEQPSGEYMVLLNTAMHPDAEKLADWITFFSGGEIAYIFEDVSCSVPKGDQGALRMARSFQSRLPENQMKVHAEDASLLCSQADNGLFDIIILSREYADAYRAESARSDEVQVLALTGAEGLDTP